MREPYARVFVHLVWATWDRLPLIEQPIRQAVYNCIQAEAHSLGCFVEAIGGIEDHVHVLVQQSPAVSIARLVKQIKGASSHMVNHELRPGGFFKWQGSYGVFSVSETHVGAVRNYIRRQEQHHRTGRLNAALERTTRE